MGTLAESNRALQKIKRLLGDRLFQEPVLAGGKAWLTTQHEAVEHLVQEILREMRVIKSTRKLSNHEQLYVGRFCTALYNVQLLFNELSLCVQLPVEQLKLTYSEALQTGVQPLAHPLARQLRWAGTGGKFPENSDFKMPQSDCVSAKVS